MKSLLLPGALRTASGLLAPALAGECATLADVDLSNADITTAESQPPRPCRPIR